MRIIVYAVKPQVSAKRNGSTHRARETKSAQMKSFQSGIRNKKFKMQIDLRKSRMKESGKEITLEMKFLTFKARLDWPGPGYGPKGNAKVVRIVSNLSKERVSADAQKTLVMEAIQVYSP